MNVLGGLFLPLRGKILTLKTDAPDGIELGGKDNEEKVLDWGNGFMCHLFGVIVVNAGL